MVKGSLKDESVFAYTLYCDSGFVIFSSAVGTRTRLNKQRNILVNELDSKEKKALYIETHAAEWDYYGGARLGLFEKINNLTQLIIDSDYDGELTGIYQEGDFDGSNYDDFYEFYINLVIELCLKLKEQNSFNIYPFESDILLGIQFADPDENEK